MMGRMVRKVYESFGTGIHTIGQVFLALLVAGDYYESVSQIQFSLIACFLVKY
jgi:hypothetical protein